jgi:hypothetical protein
VIGPDLCSGLDLLPVSSRFPACRGVLAGRFLRKLMQ